MRGSPLTGGALGQRPRAGWLARSQRGRPAKGSDAPGVGRRPPRGQGAGVLTLLVLFLALSRAVALGGPVAPAPCGLRSQPPGIELAGVGRVALTGPLDAVTLEAGAAPTLLRAGLGPGERRALLVPLAAAAAGGTPSLQAFGGGEARWLGWERPPDATESLSPGLARLARRARPPVARRPPRPGAAHPAWLLASLLAILAARRRPLLATAVAAVAVAGLWALPLAGRAAAVTLVLEGDGARWLATVEGPGLLPLPVGSPPRVERPGGDRSPFVVELTPGGEVRWSIEAAPGVRALLLPAFTPRLTDEENGLGTLAPLWRRERDGRVVPRAPWAAGSAPPPETAGPAPPAWLVAYLPQGRGGWIGGLPSPPVGLFPLEDLPKGRVWVRWLGR